MHDSGVAASPYLAVQAFQRMALDFGTEFPKASEHVTSSFYVDDLLAGAGIEEASGLQSELRTLGKKGKEGGEEKNRKEKERKKSWDQVFKQKEVLCWD